MIAMWKRNIKFRRLEVKSPNRWGLESPFWVQITRFAWGAYTRIFELTLPLYPNFLAEPVKSDRIVTNLRSRSTESFATTNVRLIKRRPWPNDGVNNAEISADLSIPSSRRSPAYAYHDVGNSNRIAYVLAYVTFGLGVCGSVLCKLDKSDRRKILFERWVGLTLN